MSLANDSSPRMPPPDLGGWEGHERRQLLYYMQLPLADKVRWLEEAADTARKLARARAEGSGSRQG